MHAHGLCSAIVGLCRTPCVLCAGTVAPLFKSSPRMSSFRMLHCTLPTGQFCCFHALDDLTHHTCCGITTQCLAGSHMLRAHCAGDVREPSSQHTRSRRSRWSRRCSQVSFSNAVLDEGGMLMAHACMRASCASSQMCCAVAATMAKGQTQDLCVILGSWGSNR